MSILSDAIKGVSDYVRSRSSSNNSSSSSSRDSGSSSNRNSSSSSNSSSSNSNRQTAYTWKDGTTTFSNSNNYLDAAKEAGKEGVGLSSAVSYGTSGNNSSGNNSGNRDYMDALNHEANVASQNGLNNSRSLDDLYNYYHNLPDDQKKNSLYYSEPTVNSSSSLHNKLSAFDNGTYKPSTNTTANNNSYNNTSLADVKAAYNAAANGTGTATSPYTNRTVANNNVSATAAGATSGITNSNGINLDALYNTFRDQNNTNIEVPEYTGPTAKQIKNSYADIYDNLQNANSDYLNSLKAQYDAQKSDTNAQYDKEASSNYINYLLGQNQLNSQLAANGINGGASESALMSLTANYQNNQLSTGQSRATALRDITNSYNSTEAQSYQQLADAYSTIQQNMVSAIASAAQAENDYNKWVAEYQQSATESDRNFALQKAQAALDEYNQNKDYALQLQQANEQAKEYQDSLEQQTVQNAYSAAGIGDFSQLKALGINTAAAEKAYNLQQAEAQANLTTTNLQNSKLSGSLSSYGSSSNTSKKKVTNPKSKTNNNTSSKSSDTSADINKVLDQYLGNFTSTNGLIYNAKYLINKGIMTKNEYNTWAKSRGHTTI